MAVSQPDMPGALIGDIWFGDPVKRTMGTHRWTGEAWEELPSEVESLVQLLGAGRTHVQALTAENARLREVLERIEALDFKDKNPVLEASFAQTAIYVAQVIASTALYLARDTDQ